LYTEQFDAVCGHHRDEVMCIVSIAWGLICGMERNGTEHNCGLKRRTTKVAQDSQRLTARVLGLCLLPRDNQVSGWTCILFAESRNSGRTFQQKCTDYV